MTRGRGGSGAEVSVNQTVHYGSHRDNFLSFLEFVHSKNFSQFTL